MFRKEHFNAAHRLHNPAWDTATNQRVFGKCSNPHYHGHNYELVVQLTGPLDPQTGFVVDLKLLADLIRQEVIEPFDHKNLNEQVEAFRTLNPTAENIALVIYERLRPRLDAALALKIRLYETERNFVEYPA